MSDEEHSERETLSISPADICFMPTTDNSCEINQNSLPSESPPENKNDNSCLEVVEKGGVYFALDSGRLGELKRLHREGVCSSIGIKLLPLSSIPQVTQDNLAPPIPARQKGRLHGRGPLKLLSFIHPERRCSLSGLSTDEETDDDTDRSDSECDWIADSK